MSATSGKPDDAKTIGAIAVIAMCIATAAHEAAGHGSACLALGGRITQLTSVYFDCSVKNFLIAGAGPLGNIAAFVLSWLALKIAPRQAPRLRLLLLLIMAISIFWAAGYLLYSAVLNEGDNAIVAQVLFGAPDWPWRACEFALGAALYVAGARVTALEARPFASAPGRVSALLRASWVWASAAACVVAALYAPDRVAAIGQALLEIGAAAVPLRFIGTRVRAGVGSESAIARSAPWIVSGILVFAVFAATLGRGLP